MSTGEGRVAREVRTGLEERKEGRREEEEAGSSRDSEIWVGLERVHASSAVRVSVTDVIVSWAWMGMFRKMRPTCGGEE